MHVELQPDYVYQQRLGIPGPNKGLCVCRLCRSSEEDRKKRLKQGQAENSFNANLSVPTGRAKETS